MRRIIKKRNPYLKVFLLLSKLSIFLQQSLRFSIGSSFLFSSALFSLFFFSQALQFFSSKPPFPPLLLLFYFSSKSNLTCPQTPSRLSPPESVDSPSSFACKLSCSFFSSKPLPALCSYLDHHFFSISFQSSSLLATPATLMLQRKGLIYPIPIRNGKKREKTFGPLRGLQICHAF